MCSSCIAVVAVVSEEFVVAVCAVVAVVSEEFVVSVLL